MNSKRQTAWLVSMLSLMVVLSAYYLFTEDVNQLDLTATEKTTEELVLQTNDLTGLINPAAGTDAAATSAKADAEPGAAAATDQSAVSTETAAEQDKIAVEPEAVAVSGTALSEADAQVLQQLQTTAKSGADYFIALQMKRDEQLSKQVEQLMTVHADPEQTPVASAEALEQIRGLENMQSKISDIEDELMKQFPQAVVTQEANKWKVTVQATKLERSQALSITETLMNKLDIGLEQIAGVTYKP